MKPDFYSKLFSLVFFSSILIVMLPSCSREKKINPEILAIPVELKVERFDERFAKATPENLDQLKNEFPYLFPAQFHDSIWIQKTQDTIQQKLEAAVAQKFEDFSMHKSEIELLFQHFLYYFEDFTPPKIITLINEVDYHNKAIYADTLLLLGLDNFLGQEHELYKGVHHYISKNLIPEQIAPQIAHSIAQRYVPPPAQRTFLDLMIYHGKMLHLKQRVLPLFPEYSIIGYTPDQLDWARANESEIWRYFIERELLFSTDPRLPNRFINLAPFSKFYLELDNESPGRLGQYMGWQIVNAFANSTNLSLNELLHTPADQLYKKSRFKPRR